MFKFILPAVVLLNTFFVQNIFAGTPGVAEFPNEKTIILPELTEKTTVKLSLDENAMEEVNNRFSNFNLLDSQNEEVPFKLFYKEVERIAEGVTVIKTSSQKDGKPEYLIDNDVLTVFSFDEKVDRQDPSTFVIDLGQPLQIVRANIYDTAERVRYVEIKGGLEDGKFRTIISKRPFNWQFNFHSPSIRYLQISLWGVGVKIDDMKLFSAKRVEVYFDAIPGEKYKVFYGGTVDSIRYKERIDQSISVTTEAQLTREKGNPLFPVDFDEDGINNDVDNCPFASNPLQKDTDGDRVGEICDNASEVKNSNQYDTDYDGVGDTADNCVLESNKDQEDRDSDGYGDACDTAHGKESMEFTTKEIVLWGFGGGVILVALIFLGWKYEARLKRLAKKAKSKK